MISKILHLLFAGLVCSWLVLSAKAETRLNTRHEQEVMALRFKIIDLKSELKECKKQVPKAPEPAVLRLSAYSLEPTQCDLDPKHTATMARPKPGSTVAVSRDRMHWLGKKVYVEGVGVRKVQDLMHPRFKNAMDLLGPTKWASNFTPREARVVLLQ